MPRYRFLVGNRKTVCEMSGIRLPDNETARMYAIAFASEIFRLHHEVCAGEWHICSVHALAADEEEVFRATVPEAAAMEREQMLLQHGVAANN
jgi:hypothetical protein